MLFVMSNFSEVVEPGDLAKNFRLSEMPFAAITDSTGLHHVTPSVDANFQLSPYDYDPAHVPLGKFLRFSADVAPAGDGETGVRVGFSTIVDYSTYARSFSGYEVDADGSVVRVLDNSRGVLVASVTPGPHHVEMIASFVDGLTVNVALRINGDLVDSNTFTLPSDPAGDPPADYFKYVGFTPSPGGTSIANVVIDRSDDDVPRGPVDVVTSPLFDGVPASPVDPSVATIIDETGLSASVTVEPGAVYAAASVRVIADGGAEGPVHVVDVTHLPVNMVDDIQLYYPGHADQRTFSLSEGVNNVSVRYAGTQ